MTQSQTPQERSRHRAWIAVKAEAVLHGYWHQKPDAPVMREIFKGWMDALENYPAGEIEEAFREHVTQNPNQRPNFGHIRSIIIRNRAANRPALVVKPEPVKERIAPERAHEILAEIGFNVKRFGGAR